MQFEMKINEIFYSIQGEGKWTGRLNIFIRTTGCNLRCSYCDTKYAYYDGKELTIEQIMDEINKYPCKNICLTGGEPLTQEETFTLLQALLKNDYKICLETNGSINIKKLPKDENIIVSMDIKCPSSNMVRKNVLENIKYLQKKDQIKFIIKNDEDYEYAVKIIQEHKPECDIFFQPVWGADSKRIAKKIKNDNLDVRLGLQLHKIIWGGKTGV